MEYDQNRGKWCCGCFAVVRVTLKDGTFHEDIGYGTDENPKKGSCVEKAKKVNNKAALKSPESTFH